MAYRERQKISQMTPKGSDLEATDLVEVSVLQSGSYVTKSITGQEIINAAGGGGSGYVPYTGANQNVDLGEYELKAGQLTLDVSPTGTAAVGTTRWNDTIGSSETTLKGGSVILKNGVDLVARVVNKVTPNATLTKANYTAVRVSGAQGQRLAVAYAQANNDNNSADTIGLVTETIATNQEGFIITVGQIEDINTTGSLQGETWADGDVLYLSAAVAGAITNIKPTAATAHIVIIGYVEYAHAVHGKIYVKIMNGWELDELHNVYIDPATLANNDALVYESATQLWKNKVVTSSLAVGTSPISSGTIGRVLFQGAGNVLQQDASFFWDNTNKRLGIGATPSTSVRLDVRAQGALSTDIAFRVRNSADTRNFLIVNGAGDVFNNGAGGVTDNTFFGENVGRSTSGNYNTFFGKECGRNNTTGNQNDFFGFNAGLNNTTGFFNSFFGANSGSLNTTGQQNAFFGHTSGQNSTGSYNSLIGYGAGKFTTGFYNSFLGNTSGGSNTTGEQNVFLGFYTGAANTTSSFNTFVGANSAVFQNSGANNTYLGHNSGRFYSGNINLTISNNSVFIGKDTKALANNQTNQIVIGFDAVGAGSNTATIGNTSIVKTILRGTLNAANLPTSSAGLVSGDIWNNGGVLNIV